MFINIGNMIYMIYMIRSKNVSISFKQKQFEFEEFCKVTGLKENSARNLISDLVKKDMISINQDTKDKRKRYYTNNWLYIVEKLKHPDEDCEEILTLLDLQEYDGRHVLLEKFEVIDSDESLMELVKRHWGDPPNEDRVTVPVGIIQDAVEFGFTIE